MGQGTWARASSSCPRRQLRRTAVGLQPAPSGLRRTAAGLQPAPSGVRRTAPGLQPAPSWVRWAASSELQSTTSGVRGTTSSRCWLQRPSSWFQPAPTSRRTRWHGKRPWPRHDQFTCVDDEPVKAKVKSVEVLARSQGEGIRGYFSRNLVGGRRHLVDALLKKEKSIKSYGERSWIQSFIVVFILFFRVLFGCCF